MAIRDKLSRNVQPYLEPDERVQAVFPGTSRSPWFLPLTGYVFFFLIAKYVIIAVTDRRILLLKANPFATTKPKQSLGSFPRETRLGPVSGIYGKIKLGGTRYYVHRRFHEDIKAADAADAPPVPASA
jgi:hypothetical protein